MLEASGLEHRCLFKGNAYDELKNVAPWIARLEEGNAFTRNLFTRSSAPWHLWDTEPGIYIRAHGTLDEMWKHFRKFTKVKDEEGKWFYFRFWEPVGATVPLFDFMLDHPNMAAAWFQIGTTSYIINYIYQDYRDNVVRCACFNPETVPHERSRFDTFTKAQRAHGMRYLTKLRCYELSKRLRVEFPLKLEPYSITEIENRLRLCSNRMHCFGIRQQEYLTQVFIWDLLIGEAFERRPQYKPVLEALQSRKREPMKFDLVRRLMHQISPNLEIDDE